MFIKTTLKTADSALIPIEIKNNQPEHTYFTGKLDPEKPKEVYKGGRTFEVMQGAATIQRDEKNNDDNCITDSKKLAIKAKEPKNDQRDLSCRTEDGVTTNKERTPSNDVLDMHTLQTGISGVYNGIIRILKLN